MKRTDLIEDNSSVSVRLRAVCKKHGIMTIGQLMDMTPSDMMPLWGFGPKATGEIEDLRYELKKSETKQRGDKLTAYVTVCLQSDVEMLRERLLTELKEKLGKWCEENHVELDRVDESTFKSEDHEFCKVVSVTGKIK